MIVYLPQSTMAAKVKEIRKALTAAGHKVSYIGHCPVDPDRKGPCIVGLPADSQAHLEAFDLVEKTLGSPAAPGRIGS